MNAQELTLYSSATRGAEEEFGKLAEQHGIQEINYSFAGHPNTRSRGLRELTRDELIKGDVSLHYVSRLLNRNYTEKGDTFRKVLQTQFHIINSSREVFVIGEIQDDQTVRGGTGWGAEFAKLCNKTLHVFDQKQDGWFLWEERQWKNVESPEISEREFAGVGTRFLEDNGRKAITELYQASLG